MRRRLIPLAAMALLTASMAATDGAVTFRSFITGVKSAPKWSLTVDSVMRRDDVTRIYGRLEWKPNRPGRIDSIRATATDRRTFEATDIDGIDLQRWFQWEDDGVISLEIDFPPALDPTKPWQVDAATNTGRQSWIVIPRDAKEE